MDLVLVAAIVVAIVVIVYWYRSRSTEAGAPRMPQTDEEPRRAASKPASKPSPPLPPDEPVTLPGEVTVGVAGEYYHRGALRRITGRRVGVVEATAKLEREPANRYDPNAVKVVVRGLHIGYLARDDARQYQPMMRRLEGAGQPAVVPVVIESRYDGDELDHQAAIRLPRPSYGETA